MAEKHVATKKKKTRFAEERRAWPRLENKIPLKVLHANPPKIEGAPGFSIDPFWTRDLGGGGLGINATVQCPIGSVLDITFTLPGRDRPITATVAVVYSKQENESGTSFRLGCSYKKIDEEERLAIIYYVNDHLP